MLIAMAANTYRKCKILIRNLEGISASQQLGRGDLETWMGYTNPDDNAVWLNAFGFGILDYKHDGFVFDENGRLKKQR